MTAEPGAEDVLRKVTERRRKSRRRQLIGIVLGVTVIVATFLFVLPRIANYGDVWRVVRDLTWLQIVVLAIATVLNLVTFAPPWMVALPQLGFRRAFLLTQASTASTYIAPGGAAVGVALSVAVLRGWGFSRSAVGLASAVIGIWNQLALLGFPALALALLTLEKEQNALLQTVALIGLAAFVVAASGLALALSTAKLAHLIGDTAARYANWVLGLVRRGVVRWTGDSFVRFRNDAIGLLRRRWHILTVATLAGQLSVFVLLLVTLRVLNVSAGEVSAVEVFAAWSLVRLLGSLPITPGGIGVVEVGLTTALVGFGGGNAEVVAAVLVYRFLTIVPTLVLGLVAFATFRRVDPARTNSP
jgi:uncharacterized protein (TIRG00374 family)